jgi:hypothetical protein
VVSAPWSTDTKDGSNCEFLQSLELHTTAMNWIMLLRNVVTERYVTECESNCLVWRDTVQFGRKGYVIAPSWYESNKNTLRHILEESNCHIQSITVYYTQKPLNVCECASNINSFGRLNVLIMPEGYCKLLLICRRMICVGVAACSVSVQVLPFDPVSHFHTLRYKLTLRLCTYRVTCWRVRVTIVAMGKQQCLQRVVELHITVSCI